MKLSIVLVLCFLVGCGGSGKDGVAFAGANGQPGAAGSAGPKGDDGAPGPKGATGASGAVGSPGSQGEQGPPGAAGVAGVAGPKGDKGATGAQGPTGPQGPQGIQGAPGPKGDVGPQGTIITKSNLYTVNYPSLQVPGVSNRQTATAYCNNAKDILLHGGCWSDAPPNANTALMVRESYPVNASDSNKAAGWSCEWVMDPAYDAAAVATCITVP